jgi:hypothetical protein
MSNLLKDKLFNYKEFPPANVWKQISASLDSEIHFPGKLYNFIATPPHHLWSAIEGYLDDRAKLLAPVPIYRQYSKILRYSAVAAILIAIVFSATELISRRSVHAPTAFSSQPRVQKTLTGNIQKSNTPVLAYHPRKEAALARTSEKKHSFKSFLFPERKTEEIAPVEDTYLAIETPTITPVSTAVDNHPDLSLADRFMVYTDEDGNHMKLPKKLFSVIHCNTDDFSCKQNLQNLQQKISSASISADFGGFLDMLKQLQENH